MIRTKEIIEWVKSLKAGDPVAVVSENHGNKTSVIYTTVKKITPTGIIVVETSKGVLKFRPDGRERKSQESYQTWYTSICPRSDELSDWMERTRILKKIQNTDFKTLPTDIMREIEKSLNKEVI